MLLVRAAALLSQLTASRRQQVEAFLNRSKRCGFCPSDLLTFGELPEESDQKLFEKVNGNPTPAL